MQFLTYCLFSPVTRSHMVHSGYNDKISLSVCS